MSRRILLVEDEALIALAEAQMLKKRGYEVLTAHNGETAIETVDSEAGISLILMDIDLGRGMDGTEAAERILARHDLPIAFLSSHTEPEVVEKTEGITSYGYILKNSDETVLLASVRMAFRLYEAHMELKRQKVDLDSTLRSYEQTAEELEHKNEELERYFTSSLDMLCIANTEGCFVRMNPEWEKVLGYPVGELEGRSFLDFVHPEDRRATWEAVARLDAGQDVTSFENRLRSRDGSYRWIEWRSRPIESMIYAAARDVTDRKRAEHEVEAREENLRITLGSIGDAVISTDTEGRITRINPVAESLCGWGTGEASGKPLTEVFHMAHADTGERVENPVTKVLETGEIIALANHTMLISKDGTKYQIADSAAPIRDDSGITAGVVLVFRDVTEEYRVAQALADSERNMARAQAMAQLGSWRIDLDSKLMIGSNQACGIYGVSPSVVSLECVQSLPLPEYRPLLDDAMASLVQDGAPYDVEFEVRRPSDGSVRWIHSVAEYDAEHHRIVGTIQDITERKQTEEALRREHARFAMIAETSPVGITTLDEVGSITYANTAAERVLGLTRDRITSRAYNEPTWQSTDLDGRPLPDEAHPFYVVKSTGRSVRGVQHSIIRSDGTRVDLSINGCPIFDDDGQFRGMVATIEDITELRCAEKQLREANRHLSSVLDSIDAIVYICDMQTYETVYLNECARRVFGDKAGQKCWRALQGHDEPCSFCTNDRLLDEHGRPTGTYAWEHHNSLNGRWYDCRDRAVQWVDGRMVRVEVAIDITKRKRSEERLQKIIDHSPLVINEIAASGHYLMVNDATCALLGMTREKLVGKHLDELLPADTAATFEERIDHIAMTQQQMTVDDVLHIGGRERVFRSVLFPVGKHDDSLPSVIAMAYELTKEIRLAKEKDLLMRELNHRVKNSLTMVSSLVKLKESHSEADLSDVEHQINTISLLHEKLNETESVTEICLKSYIGGLLSSIVSFSARRVRVEQEIDDICVPTQQAMSLGLIVNELATNAIKHGFTDTEAPILSVRIEDDRKKSLYQMTISNTGRPFPQEIGLDNPQTLGLQLVSALTAQLGGTIELQRAPHPVFMIRFPAGE
jgi:PAS domain S-box-containing protein